MGASYYGRFNEKWMSWDVLKGKVESLVYGMFNEKNDKVGVCLKKKLGALLSLRRHNVKDGVHPTLRNIVLKMLNQFNQSMQGS